MSAHYEFNVTLNCDAEQAISKLTEVAHGEKLGIVSDVNVQAIMKNKLDKDIEPYRILGLCAPGLALKVIEAEPNAGVLLPCNVVVRGQGKKTVISFMAPDPILAMVDNAAATEVAEEATGRLQRIAAALQD